MPTPCTKITYDSRRDAHVAIARIIKSHRAKKLNVYRCEHCELWHLSHQKLKKGKRSKKQMLALTTSESVIYLTFAK